MKAYAGYFRKGLVALAGALVSLGFALSEVSAAGPAITGAEWIAVALAALTAAGVAVVPANGPKPE